MVPERFESSYVEKTVKLHHTVVANWVKLWGFNSNVQINSIELVSKKHGRYLITLKYAPVAQLDRATAF